MKSNRIRIFLAVILGLILIFGIAIAVRLRNSFVLKPVAAVVPENVVYFSQKDDAWKTDHLGNSVYRMKKSGCLTTCIASVTMMEQLDNKNPGEMNILFSQNNVYDGEGNIQWNELEQCLDVTVVRSDVTNGSEILSLLQQGIFPIVRVRAGRIGNYHYMVIVGSTEKTFLCMDPLNNSNEIVPLSAVGDRIYAIRYIKLDRP